MIQNIANNAGSNYVEFMTKFHITCVLTGLAAKFFAASVFEGEKHLMAPSATETNLTPERVRDLKEAEDQAAFSTAYSFAMLAFLTTIGVNNLLSQK